MLDALLKEVRSIIWAVAVVAAVGVWGFVELHRPVAHATTPVASATNVAREVQAVVEASKSIAAASGSAPTFSQPAVAVIRDTPGLQGFTPAQIAQILAGLKPPTREVVAVSSKLVGPSPAPTPTAVPGLTADELRAVYQADKAAVSDVLADPQTHIATTVSVTREEVQPTRVGSLFTPNGSGLGFAVARRKHLEINLGAVIRGSHLSPALQAAWLIPHTSVAIGPSVTYDRRAIIGVAATVHF